MTIEQAATLQPGARIMVKRDRGRVRDAKPATVISRPSAHHARATFGFLWVRFDGSNMPELRQYTIHARQITKELLNA